MPGAGGQLRRWLIAVAHRTVESIVPCPASRATYIPELTKTVFGQTLNSMREIPARARDAKPEALGSFVAPPVTSRRSQEWRVAEGVPARDWARHILKDTRKIKVNAMKQLSVIIIVVFVAFLTSSNLAAQQIARPLPDSCENLDRSQFDDRGDWINARIDCRHQNINSKLWDLVEDVENNSPAGLFSDEQLTHFRNERGRVEKERHKTFEAGGFKGIAKRQDAICQIVEIDDDGKGNNDGICEPGEDCAEVLDDGIGDDDGICKPTKGKKKEVCIQLCDQDAASAIDDNFDEETLYSTEANLAGVESLIETSRVQVSRMNSAMIEMSLMQAGLGEGSCANLLYPENIPAGGERRSYEVMQATLGAANAADWAHAACDSGAEQTVFGANAAAVCTVLAVAAGIVDVIYDAFELQDDTITSERLDAAIVCLEQLDKKSSDTLEKLDGVQEKLDQIVDLLNTPQGRRPGFPTGQ